MTRCGECGQPVHPHQMTCGSCGVSLRENPPASAVTPELEKPDEAESFTLDDPLAPSAGHAEPPGASEPAGPSVEDEPRDRPAGPSVVDEPRDRPAGRSVLDDPEGEPTEWALAPPRSARRRRPLPPRPPAAASSPAFFSRAWALMVDLMLLSLVGSLLPSVAWLGIRAAEAVSGTTELYDDMLTEQLTTIGEIVLFAGYFLFLHGSGGQTVGKGLMGLRVVCADGRPLDPGKSLARVCGYVFSALPLGVGFLLAAFPPRRALHDYLAGTIVVRERDMPQPEGEDPSS